MSEARSKQPTPAPKRVSGSKRAPGEKTPARPRPGEKPAAKPVAKPTPSPAKAPTAAKTEKESPPAQAEPSEEIKIVEEAEAKKPAHKARAKPQLTPEQVADLRLRGQIDDRRPAFRRQQWYEYRRLEKTGWRRPRGQDSAMRRHFGYESPVVRVGYRGPATVRGLHASGFQEVRVENVHDLAAIDPKRQAARVSGTVGKRNLPSIYKAADERGIRVLNRRSL